MSKYTDMLIHCHDNIKCTLPRLKTEPDTLLEALQVKCLNKFFTLYSKQEIPISIRDGVFVPAFQDTIQREKHKIALAAKYGLERFFYYNLHAVQEMQEYITFAICHHLTSVIEEYSNRGLITKEVLLLGHCMAGDLEKVQEWDDWKSKWVYKGLCCACQCGQIKVVRFLIEKNALLRIREHSSLFRGSINCIECAMRGGHEGCIYTMIKQHNKLYSSNMRTRNSVLKLAAFYNRASLVEYYLSKGADDMESTAYAAVLSGAKECTSILLKRQPMDVTVYVCNRNLHFTKFMCEEHPTCVDVNRLFHSACKNGNEKVIAYLKSLKDQTNKDTIV
jgi:hypothetical protein